MICPIHFSLECAAWTALIFFIAGIGWTVGAWLVSKILH